MPFSFLCQICVSFERKIVQLCAALSADRSPEETPIHRSLGEGPYALPRHLLPHGRGRAASEGGALEPSAGPKLSVAKAGIAGVAYRGDGSLHSAVEGVWFSFDRLSSPSPFERISPLSPCPFPVIHQRKALQICGRNEDSYAAPRGNQLPRCHEIIGRERAAHHGWFGSDRLIGRLRFLKSGHCGEECGELSHGRLRSYLVYWPGASPPRSIRRWISVNTRTRRGRFAFGFTKGKITRFPRRLKVICGWERTLACSALMALGQSRGSRRRVSIFPPTPLEACSPRGSS